MKNNITMAVQDFVNYTEDENLSLSFGKVTPLTTLKNSHNFIFTEENIRKFAPTFLGKPIIAEYDNIAKDAKSHTDFQQVVGYIPTNQEIQYTYDESGNFQATFDYVMFKLYSSGIYEVLKRDIQKSVSLEGVFNCGKPTNKGIPVEDMEGVGITILANTVLPSIPNANIVMTQMSEIDIEKEYEKFSQHKNQNDFDINTKILTVLENIDRKLELNKEDIMVDKKEEIQEEVILETIETPVEEEKLETEVALEEKDEKEVEDKDEETEEVDEKEDETEKMSELETKCANLEIELQAKNKIIAELQEFKNKAQETEKLSIVEATMSKVKELTANVEFDTVKMDNFYSTGRECLFENINAWKNEVLAEMVEFVMNAPKIVEEKAESVIEMKIPKAVKKYNSIYK